MEYFSIKQNQKEKIKQEIKKTLKKERGIVFAYLYGSFLNAPSFRDIDIGVYLNQINRTGIDDYELNIAEKIAAKIDFSFEIIEVKILNFAPDSFLNNIFSKGELLFSNNQELLTNLIEKTSLTALANEHIANQSLKELIPT